MIEKISSYDLRIVQEQLSKTANDPSLTITTVHTFGDANSAGDKFTEPKKKSGYLSYWRIYGETDQEYSDRLNKAMSEGHISYSEMLTLTKPTKPQADPLNPVEEPEKQAPWE